jgi:putative hemolysin
MSASRAFRLDPLLARFVPGPVASALAPPLEHLLALRRLEREYGAVRSGGGPVEFARAGLARLGADFRVEGAVDAVPDSGPLVLVANHPFGGLEGLFLYQWLAARRPDTRVLGNELLSRFEEFRPALLTVDVLGGRSATARNAAALRRALRFVADGGALVVFPAGEVSSLRLAGRTVADPDWNAGVARLIRLARARVVPAYVDGANSALFHAAGLLHPRLRTALLPRELLNKRDRAIAVRIGAPIAAAQVAAIEGDGPLIEHLRLRVYSLAGPSRGPESPVPNAPTTAAEVAPAGDPAALAAEIASLPPDRMLGRTGDLEVWHAAGSEIPRVLHEVGRLRELTFRAVGEGTGRARDVDLYDDYYRQLFLWNPATREIAGGYRIGHVDQILARYGVRGLYTHTLFALSKGALPHADAALELGRSFVRPEYQKSFAPLLLLWKGIAAYVAAHPRYRVLFGPVSISNDYTPAGRALLTGYLRARHGVERLRPIRPRRPLPDDDALRLIRAEASAIGSLEALEAAVAAVEPDGKGVPVLVRQYLKLGARVMSFNVDPAFGHSIDVLVAVDLAGTDPRVLAKYMGREAAERYRARHGATAESTGDATPRAPRRAG